MMRRRHLLVLFSFFAFAFSSAQAQAAVDLDDEGFRIYCGYLDALEDPAVKKLPAGAAQDKKIAQMAKLKPEKLLSYVEKGRAIGATCQEVAKVVEADIKKELDAAFPKRIDLFDVDSSDPSHVVVTVRWKAPLGLLLEARKKKLVEEAAAIASIVANNGPISRTIAVRAVDVTAADLTSDEAILFEGKISRTRAANIKRDDKLADYAETRYLKLFDGVIRR